MGVPCSMVALAGALRRQQHVRSCQVSWLNLHHAEALHGTVNEASVFVTTSCVTVSLHWVGLNVSRVMTSGV